MRVLGRAICKINANEPRHKIPDLNVRIMEGGALTRIWDEPIIMNHMIT